MLDVLLESRGVRAPRPLLEATLSVLAHGALIVALVAGPALGKRAAEDPPLQETTVALYVVPPDQAGPRQNEHLQFVSEGEKGSAADRPSEGEEPANESSAPRSDETNAVSTQRTLSNGDAYSVLDVDSAAVRDPSSAAPAYPVGMMHLAIEGTATIKFVIDTAGRVDLGTVQTLTATNAAFANAVLVALPRMRFHPAHIGEKPVRQISQEEFKFQLTHLAAEHP
jgi:TonB family protein